MEYKEQLTIYTKELEECVDVITSERKKYEIIKLRISRLFNTISVVSSSYSDGSFKVDYSMLYDDQELVEKIIKITCDVSGMTKKILLSSSRKKEHVIYRHILCYLLKENTNFNKIPTIQIPDVASLKNDIKNKNIRIPSLFSKINLKI